MSAPVRRAASAPPACCTAEPRAADIAAALRRALSPELADLAQTCDNPYGDGHAAERIVATLRRVLPLSGPLIKRFHDLPGTAADPGTAAVPAPCRRGTDVFDDRRVLALIPARGGSKGLPGKNVAPLGGRPLIAWTIAAARGSAFVDEVVVSTDDEAIARAAAAAGARVPFRRPAALAGDEARMGDVIAHALETLAATDPPYGWLRTAAADLAAAHRGPHRRGLRPPDREQGQRGRVGLRGRAQPALDGRAAARRQHGRLRRGRGDASQPPGARRASTA